MIGWPIESTHSGFEHLVLDVQSGIFIPIDCDHKSVRSYFAAEKFMRTRQDIHLEIAISVTLKPG